MRVVEMHHPLCCISLDSAGIEDQSPVDSKIRRNYPAAFPLSVGGSGGSERCNGNNSGSDVKAAGVLYKWTNYGKGWRTRWFLLNNGVLSYSKIWRWDCSLESNEIRVIGDSSFGFSRIGSQKRKYQDKSLGVVHLKISSFRESKSDDRRFYIFTATKTLHLRTDSRQDRMAWMEALGSAKTLFTLSPLNNKLFFIQNDISISTTKLRDRLLQGGVCEELIKDCERIMLSEFSELQRQMKALDDERFNLFDTLKQLEVDNIEVETAITSEGHFQLMKDEFSSNDLGKFSECSTTESSDDVEKQELVEEESEEDEVSFYDSNDYLGDFSYHSMIEPMKHGNMSLDFVSPIRNLEVIQTDAARGVFQFPHVERRKKLPDPLEQEKGVSLWSMLKDNVGKDLTHVCLPVYFNEPTSSLQKCFEDLEYSYLLDEAYEFGKVGNNLMRILKVAAFAVSGYASSQGRHCKPFNPLLGETYEADFPDKGIRFFSEKVSHHPMLIACHCEGRGWKFWGESNLRSKFWGRSIQLDPVGILNLEFDDGERFWWSKVTTTIYNLIFGKIYCDHHGTMHIHGNRQYSCKLKFKEQSILERNPHQVHGVVEDTEGKNVATLCGKWDENMYYVKGGGSSWSKYPNLIPGASLLWEKNKLPENATRYNLTSFAITLNELTPGLKEKLPPTDSRLRPDQRHLENGEYEKANAEKLRLERRQRMSRKFQERGWKPRWFRRDGENGPFCYIGGYWEAREQKNWEGCPNIFGEISDCENPVS